MVCCASWRVESFRTVKARKRQSRIAAPGPLKISRNSNRKALFAASWLEFSWTRQWQFDEESLSVEIRGYCSHRDVDPMPIWPQTTAIFKDARHPNAAKLYITWFLAKEQQSRTGTWSTRLDVPPPSGLKPMSTIDLPMTFAASPLMRSSPRRCVSGSRVISASRKDSR